jgi:hypothetical protein
MNFSIEVHPFIIAMYVEDSISVEPVAYLPYQ